MHHWKNPNLSSQPIWMPDTVIAQRGLWAERGCVLQPVVPLNVVVDGVVQEWQLQVNGQHVG